MVKHYIISAWRSLVKYRTFSLVNIGGLALSLAAFWAIALYVADELSYDRFLPDSGRIFRAVSHADWDGGRLHTATSSAPFATVLPGVPSIDRVVRVDLEGGGTVKVGEKQFDINDILATDSSFFSVFQYPFLYGSPATALSEPHSVVLTKSLAETLFGSADLALGKTVLFNRNEPDQVTGVIPDVPSATHLPFRAVRSQLTGWTDGWQTFDIYTYILLKKGAVLRDAQRGIEGSFDPMMESRMPHTRYRMELQPLPSIHLHSDLLYEASPNGHIRNLYIFIAAALLILAIAVINYINLSTARSTLRVKEVGVRKAIGSRRRHLLYLFITESVIITFLAALAGLLLVELLLPFFNKLAAKHLTLGRFGLIPSLGLASGFSLVIGLLAGAYPAFFLSGFGVLRSLKGQLGKQANNLLFRKVLVTFQFVVTISMMTALFGVYGQLRYLDRVSLGFNKDQVLSFHIPNPGVRRALTPLREKLLENPLVESASGASDPLGTNFMGARNYHFGQDRHLQANLISVDPYFLSTLQIPVTRGRNMSAGSPWDSANAMLVNETLVKEAGWKNPIGQKMQYFIDDSGHTRTAFIVGVVRDFHIYSLQHVIAPLAIYLPSRPEEMDNMYVRIGKTDVPGALAYIEKTFKTVDPGDAFAYRFLDEQFSKQYAAERNQGRVLMTFTLLAVGLACLGLFGLISFSISQRTREIGIRKVLGASTTGLVRLLSQDLLLLVGIAGCVAAPIALWAMNRWLEDFAYRIPVYWWMPVLTAGIAAGIALATMSIQALKAARANPVNALRNE